MITAAVAAPVVTASGGSLWERMEAELAQTGEVSAEVVNILLDLQGPRGIYDDPKQFESLRAALARAIPEHKAIREFNIAMDVEPLLAFRR